MVNIQGFLVCGIAFVLYNVYTLLSLKSQITQNGLFKNM